MAHSGPHILNPLEMNRSHSGYILCVSISKQAYISIYTLIIFYLCFIYVYYIKIHKIME
jgi:hypothetical protein